MGTFHLPSLSSFSFLSLSSSFLFRAKLPADTTSHPEYATIAMRNHSRPALKLNDFVFPLLDVPPMTVASSPDVSPKPSPVPSPNASTSFLDKPVSFSKESIKPAMGNSETLAIKEDPRWVALPISIHHHHR
ncbi:hypothetical protein K443DRAFT_685851 [Laccaria amethystina LaAM-08-1]|uniref:Unplaced genomic scaffold K443scaffold_449, whole genome shotgun sequence n=1 Tax=Laccaria amethystina LaAM-08-1 TaxID=1095629 RepID=A0A0C9X1W8_9AGAR|nr:hypothetical protein K443DRAFT_685851 [Laccaria amethystina LaAM-08-1]